KSVIAELVKLRGELAKKNAKSDVIDCDNIATKLTTPSKPMPERVVSTPFPGDAVYEEVLALWIEGGKTLAKLYREGAAALKDKEAEEATLFAGWFDTFPEVGRGIQQLNKRRKAMKLAPVTQDWANSIGGYLHGKYLKTNKDHPSVAGLGAHNEDRKLPGWTIEGEKAAGGILAWGADGPGTMDVWLNSRFHRSPVMNRDCGRVAFGGTREEGFSCRDVGGMSGKPLAEVITWPGDGDTDIPTSFGSELPNPFPPGVSSSGTVIVADFGGRQPKKPEWRLLDPDKKPVEILNLDTKNPICFVAKSALAAKTKYTVEIATADGQRMTWSFTTK
ncbi:MAG TPA: hypothetical protein VE981_03130, partial [Planctomycetota bacterium]|nr:hypothetical protein [Planctomycetota bacterium]